MSARSAVAQQHGADEQILDAVDDPDGADLSPVQRAALRLADAFLVAPSELTDETRREIAAELEPVQIVELVLKLTGFASDKVMVALGLDLDEVRPFLID